MPHSGEGTEMPGAGGVRVGGQRPGGPKGSFFTLFAQNGRWCERDVDLPSALQESSGNFLDQQCVLVLGLMIFYYPFLFR